MKAKGSSKKFLQTSILTQLNLKNQSWKLYTIGGKSIQKQNKSIVRKKIAVILYLILDNHDRITEQTECGFRMTSLENAGKKRLLNQTLIRASLDFLRTSLSIKSKTRQTSIIFSPVPSIDPKRHQPEHNRFKARYNKFHQMLQNSPALQTFVGLLKNYLSRDHGVGPCILARGHVMVCEAARDRRRDLQCSLAATAQKVSLLNVSINKVFPSCGIFFMQI